MTTAAPSQAFVTRSPAPLARVPDSLRPDVSFVVVTFGTGTVVIEAIASLMRSLAAADVDVEVVVVDNEHPDRPHRTSNHLLLDTAGVRVVRPGRNLGFGGGCNVGVLHSSGEMVAFVNPDVEFARGWLDPMLEALADGELAIAAPVLQERDGTVQSAGHHLFADGSTAPITSAPEPGRTGRPDYASAACWLMRRSLFDDLGGFDEAFFPAYYEDVDLALRARPHGGTGVVADSTVVHHRGASTAATVAPDTTPQRLRLIENWPSLATTQPAPPT